MLTKEITVNRMDYLSSDRPELYKFSNRYLFSMKLRDRSDIYTPVAIDRFYSPFDMNEHIRVKCEPTCYPDPDIDW